MEQSHKRTGGPHAYLRCPTALALEESHQWPGTCCWAAGEDRWPIGWLCSLCGEWISIGSCFLSSSVDEKTETEIVMRKDPSFSIKKYTATHIESKHVLHMVRHHFQGKTKSSLQPLEAVATLPAMLLTATCSPSSAGPGARWRDKASHRYKKFVCGFFFKSW